MSNALFLENEQSNKCILLNVQIDKNDKIIWLK